MSDVACQQEGYNLGLGLFLGERSVLGNLFGLLGLNKSGEKVVSALSLDGTIHDRHRAQLLEVFEKLLGLHSAKL